jgi:NAD-dependent deacetylase
VGGTTGRAGGIAVLRGAGISTGSGIPDFRGPQGVWTRDPDAARLLDWDAYRVDVGVRVAAWRMWRDHPVWDARPTAAHRALADLERAGLLAGVATQNFDGLHQAAGCSAGLVHELHGSLPGSTCRDCGAAEPTAAVLARLEAEPDPRCRRCGGLLATDVVMFGEALPRDALDAAVEAASTCEQMWAIGTTLTVQPAASLVLVAARAGARVVIVNAEPTPYDRLADEVVRTPIDEAVPGMVARVLAERGAAG